MNIIIFFSLIDFIYSDFSSTAMLHQKTSIYLTLMVFKKNIDKFNINPRPPEVFFVTHPPKGGGIVATPSLDFPYGMLDTPILATSV